MQVSKVHIQIQQNKNSRRLREKSKFQSEPKHIEKHNNSKFYQATKHPLQWWECGGHHYVKNCPYRKGTDLVAHIQEASTIGEVAMSLPNINEALEYHQVMVACTLQFMYIWVEINDSWFQIYHEIDIVYLFQLRVSRGYSLENYF